MDAPWLRGFCKELHAFSRSVPRADADPVESTASVDPSNLLILRCKKWWAL